MGEKMKAIAITEVGKTEIIELDKPVAKLNLKDNLLISFINRDGKIIIPKGSDEIKVGDTVMIVTTNAKFTSIEDILA